MASDVLFEIHRLGNAAKATAIDAETGEEAVVMAPVTISDRDLQMLALRKLRYQQGREATPESAVPSPPKGRGIIV